MDSILSPMLLTGALGLFFGVVLGIASHVFKVEIDPKINEVRQCLPGANCGACGYPGCDGLAAAIVAGKAKTNACIVGGKDAAEKIAAVMGGSAEEVEKMTAVVHCLGDCDKAKEKYDYVGLKDCRAENIFFGGSKACNYGCLGCGTCKDVCEFGAIEIVNGVAVVDREKCVACGKCTQVCPKGLISMVPANRDFVVRCKNPENGKDTRAVCSTGCIGCKLCVKNCPKEAISCEGTLASIDYTKCVNCSLCSKKCPTHAITSTKVKPGEVVEEKKDEETA